MSAVAELRTAADKLRELAEGATPGQKTKAPRPKGAGQLHQREGYQVTRDDGMTCTCTTCGQAHEVPPPVDWTHYERDVLALVDIWLTQQEDALAAIRAGRIPAHDSALKDARDRLIRTYFPAGAAHAFPILMLGQGRIDLSQLGAYTTVWRADEGVVWPAHATRPEGAS